MTGAAWFALTAAGGAPPGFAKGVDDGTPIVQRHATLPDDPWVVCHGLRAMGREFALGDGRRAVNFLLENVLVNVSPNGKTVLGFPIEVEGHRNMFLKTMLEAGVPLDHGFTHKGQRRTLQDVVDGARAAFGPRLAAAPPNTLPWSVIALTTTTSPVRRQWVNAWGETVDLDEVVERALRLLEEASLPLARAMREGKSETAQAPVHGFTCGGTHMLYAVIAAMHAGYTGKDRPARVQQQVDVLVWRLSAEVEFIERFYRTRPTSAIAGWYQLDAKLKLLGHAEECLALATRHKVAQLTAAQRTQWKDAGVMLRRILGELEGRKLEEAKALDRELYRQLVGDTCHARHGLTLV
jgi:hypothetical protein